MKVCSIFPILLTVMLLSLSVCSSVQAVPIDKWKTVIESEVRLSDEVEKGIEGAAEYIIREEISEWEECASIRCFCRVTEKEGKYIGSL